MRKRINKVECPKEQENMILQKEYGLQSSPLLFLSWLSSDKLPNLSKFLFCIYDQESVMQSVPNMCSKIMYSSLVDHPNHSLPDLLQVSHFVNQLLCTKSLEQPRVMLINSGMLYYLQQVFLNSTSPFLIALSLFNSFKISLAPYLYII